MRKEIVPEQLFVDRILLLVNNLLVENVNFKNNNGNFKYYQFFIDQKERMCYIRKEVEKTKHLIGLE